MQETTELALAFWGQGAEGPEYVKKQPVTTNCFDELPSLYLDSNRSIKVCQSTRLGLWKGRQRR